MENFKRTIIKHKKYEEWVINGYLDDKIRDLFDEYLDCLDGGVPKQEARQILPLCTMTKFYWTVNLRSLMNFLSLRMDAHAQRDILENAHEVYRLFEREYPNIAKAWYERNSAVKGFLKGWRTK